MPITGKGLELHITRTGTHRRASDGRVRTVGRYQVYLNGKKVTGWFATGATAESPGPGDNKVAGNKKRVEAGTYKLATQMGSKYVTLKYSESLSAKVYPKPGIELLGTNKRSEILIHTGIGFLASVGCINLCTSLPSAAEGIDYERSRERVISLIEFMRRQPGFPTKNGSPIPNATVVIDGEP